MFLLQSCKTGRSFRKSKLCQKNSNAPKTWNFKLVGKIFKSLMLKNEYFKYTLYETIGWIVKSRIDCSSHAKGYMKRDTRNAFDMQIESALKYAFCVWVF